MEMNSNLYLDKARGMSSLDLLEWQCELRSIMNSREVLGPESDDMVVRPNNPELLVATLGEVMLFGEPVERSVTAHAGSIQRFIGRNPYYTRWGIEEPGHGRVIRAIQEECDMEVDQTEAQQHKILYSAIGMFRHLPVVGNTAGHAFRLLFAQAGYKNEIVNMHGQANTTRIARKVGEPEIGQTYARLRAQEVTHAEYFATEISLRERGLPLLTLGARALLTVDQVTASQAPIGANTPERKAQFGRIGAILTDGKADEWVEKDVRKLAEVVYMKEAAPTARTEEHFEKMVETTLEQYRECNRLAKQMAGSRAID